MTAEWGKITAEEIVKPIKGELTSGRAGSVFKGISTDTRKILPGQLFLALRGEKYDGHDFLENALGNGASGIIVEKDRGPKISVNSDIAVIVVSDTLKALGDMANWWRNQHNVTLAAITGSVGKTTTKEMAAKILELNAKTLKNKGNLNNLIGLPLTLLRLEKGHQKAIVEMGMNKPGEIGRLTEISDPNIGIITNIAKAHLEGVGDIMGVVRAKVELMEKISPAGRLVLYGDDDLLMKEALRFQREIITYGIRPNNDISAGKIKNLGYEGTSFELQYHGHTVPVRLQVPGRMNLINALAACAIAICMKEPFDNISIGLNKFDGIKGRFRPIALTGDILLVDDTYNSNPSSLKAAFDSLKEMAVGRRRLIVGLGEMMELGKATISAHQEAGGMVADAGASHFLAMGDHAREMIVGALKKGFPPEKAVETKSHREMVQKIEALIKQGDLILLKGSRKMGLDKVFLKLKERFSKEG